MRRTFKFVRTPYSTKILDVGTVVVRARCVEGIRARETAAGANKVVHELRVELLDQPVVDYIQSVDDAAAPHGGPGFIPSLHGGRTMCIKVPFRYKKFECEFFGSGGDRLTSSDIAPSETLEVEVVCENLWSFQGHSGITWKTKLVKNMSK